MELLRVASAVAVSLGLPLLASFQPGPEGDAGYGLSSAVEAPLRAVKFAQNVPTESGIRARSLPAPSTTASPALEPQTSSNSAAAVFEREVLRLAAEADSVDRLWQVFKSDCGVSVDRDYGFGREWFAVLDHAADVNRNFPSCASMERQILQSAMDTRRDLGKVRAAAKRAGVDPATEIGLLCWHGLQWQ